MPIKQTLAYIFNIIGINKLLFRLSLKYYGNHIRVVNYHGTPETEAHNFEKQLLFFKKFYLPVSETDLENFYTSKLKYKKKPGLILSFDDGHRTNFDYALPILEKYNFMGWFFVPAGLIEGSNSDQKKIVGSAISKMHYADNRLLLNWEELKAIKSRHIVGSHTFTHHRMNSKDTAELLHKEIVESKVLLENNLQSPISSFCWVGGEKYTYTKAAAELIVKSDYKFSFMTNTYPILPSQSSFQIQRTNIETSYPLHLVQFQLGPLMDIYYWSKRKFVLNTTKTYTTK